MNNAQVADRLLANIESASGADVDEIRNNAIDSSVNGETPQIRKDAGSSSMLRSLRFKEAVRTGAVTTAGLYDRYLDQLNHDDSADIARTLRAIRRHLAWTDVDRLRRVVIAAFATVSVLFVLTEVLAGQSAIFSLAAVAVSGLVLGVLMRTEFGKSPLTGFATSWRSAKGDLPTRNSAPSKKLRRSTAAFTLSPASTLSVPRSAESGGGVLSERVPNIPTCNNANKYCNA